jgi:hypothetical protein
MPEQEEANSLEEQVGRLTDDYKALHAENERLREEWSQCWRAQGKPRPSHDVDLLQLGSLQRNVTVQVPTINLLPRCFIDSFAIGRQGDGVFGLIPSVNEKNPFNSLGATQVALHGDPASLGLPFTLLPITMAHCCPQRCRVVLT